MDRTKKNCDGATGESVAKTINSTIASTSQVVANYNAVILGKPKPTRSPTKSVRSSS